MHGRKVDTAVDTRISCKFFFFLSEVAVHFINWSFNKSDMTAIIAWYCLFYNPSASKFTKYDVSQSRPQAFSTPIFWGKSPGDEVGCFPEKKNWTKDESKSPSLTLITILEISALFLWSSFQ